jgi:hypothetical protein
VDGLSNQLEMNDLKKHYYGGYKPKPTNVVKLEAYVKNADRSVLSNDISKRTTSITNKILKNKRIK